MDIEDEAKKRLQDEYNGKGIYVSKSWDIRVVEKFFKKLFGIKTDTAGLDTKPEDQNND